MVDVICEVPRVLPRLSTGNFLMAFDQISYPDSSPAAQDGTYRYIIKRSFRIDGDSVNKNVTCLVFPSYGQPVVKTLSLTPSGKWSTDRVSLSHSVERLRGKSCVFMLSSVCMCKSCVHVSFS